MGFTTEESIVYAKRNEREGLRKLHQLQKGYMINTEDTGYEYDSADNLSTGTTYKIYANEVKNRNIPHDKFKDNRNFYGDGDMITVLLEDKKLKGMQRDYGDRILKYITFYNDNIYISFTLNDIDWSKIEFRKDFPCEQSSSEMKTSGHSHKVPKDVWMLPISIAKTGTTINNE